MGFSNKMAPAVFEGILWAKRKSEFKNVPLRLVFEKKAGHFWKIVELNTDVLESSLLSEVDNWLSIDCSLKWAQSQIDCMPWIYVKGVQEKKKHITEVLKI